MRFTGKNLLVVQSALAWERIMTHNEIVSCPDPENHATEIAGLEHHLTHCVRLEQAVAHAVALEQEQRSTP